jgi:hypothetical protein
MNRVLWFAATSLLMACGSAIVPAEKENGRSTALAGHRIDVAYYDEADADYVGPVVGHRVTGCSNPTTTGRVTSNWVSYQMGPCDGSGGGTCTISCSRLSCPETMCQSGGCTCQ